MPLDAGALAKQMLAAALPIVSIEEMQATGQINHDQAQ